MSIEICEHTNVSQQLQQLGCRVPDNFMLLPMNFDLVQSASEFREYSHAATIRTLLREQELPYEDIAERLPYVQNNALEWVLPTIFIPAALVSQNPDYIKVAVEAIFNYLTYYFKADQENSTTKLDVIVEKSKKGSCKKISYEGPAEGLMKIQDAIDSVLSE